MPRILRTTALAVLAGATVLASCTSATTDNPTGEIVPAQLLDHVNESVAELVADGLSAEDLTVLSAAAVTWPDGSLGCPEPGMIYTQQLVEGYRILVATPNGEVAFHGANGDTPFRCDNPQLHAS